ncbi:MAG TPA: DoxX family protein [Streptosporangiaceae bacterium]|nr:DoxX family protein [Streptosporangiaceae bacterium]
MRDVALLGARLVVGGYLAVHGAQKLFGAFGGSGLHKTGAGFERIGLSPGKPMATLAGATELGGGLLTAAGVADPAGPLAIMGVMSVAATTHRANGPLNANRGFELPLTNLAAAAALAVAGPGRLRIGPGLPRRLTVLGALAGGVMSAVSLTKMLSAPAAPAAQPAAQPGPAAPVTPSSPSSENGQRRESAAT